MAAGWELVWQLVGSRFFKNFPPEERGEGREKREERRREKREECRERREKREES